MSWTLTTATVTIYTEFTVQPRSADHVESLLRTLARDARADGSILAFEPHRLVDEPNRFHIYEVHRGHSALENQPTSDYRTRFVAELEPHLIDPLSQQTLLAIG